MHHWKHGRKGSGIFWLQQARDEHCLKVISQQLFDSVGKSLSDESLKVNIFSKPYSKHTSLCICPFMLFHAFDMQQWEGLVELLGSDSQISGGLDFLHKYQSSLTLLLSLLVTFSP